MKAMATTLWLFLLAACGPAANVDAPQPAVAALTAQGWGALKIGMSRADVEALVGGPADSTSMGGAEPEVCDEFHPAKAPTGLFVMIEDGLLTRISLSTGATVKTAQGLAVGDAAAAVKAAYGGKAVVEPHHYVEAPAEYITAWVGAPPPAGALSPASRGIRYEVDETGRVAVIHAGGPSIEYVEGCA